MTAGLLQLNFIGPQDKYLTGNPQMTYFKNVFKSHSNFAKELKILQFDSSVKLGSVHSFDVKISSNLANKKKAHIMLTIRCMVYQFKPEIKLNLVIYPLKRAASNFLQNLLLPKRTK